MAGSKLGGIGPSWVVPVINSPSSPEEGGAPVTLAGTGAELLADDRVRRAYLGY